ncbi:ribosomal protein S14 (mitochondrion) [Bryopsis sp. KO-2023]|nr:ribosomal protein S14 [Bryopsis sp. KO-2023]
MANSVQRDQKRRNLVYKYEAKRIEYKSIIENLSIPTEKRYNYLRKLNNTPRSSSKTRIRNRCVYTGRSRSVYRFCKLSRIILRLSAAQGQIAGVNKTTW